MLALGNWTQTSNSGFNTLPINLFLFFCCFSCVCVFLDTNSLSKSLSYMFILCPQKIYIFAFMEQSFKFWQWHESFCCSRQKRYLKGQIFTTQLHYDFKMFRLGLGIKHYLVRFGKRWFGQKYNSCYFTAQFPDWQTDTSLQKALDNLSATDKQHIMMYNWNIFQKCGDWQIKPQNKSCP